MSESKIESTPITTNLLGMKLWCITTKKFEDTVLSWASYDKDKYISSENRNKLEKRESPSPSKFKNFITYLNAHCFNLSFSDSKYRGILQKADLLYADGQAVVWASKLANAPLPERVNAGDFILDFLNRCEKRGIRLFFLGSTPEAVRKSAQYFTQETKGLQIVGTHCGYFNKDEAATVIKKINDSNADILIVGMGVPKQEIWVFKNFNEVNVKVIWCVGALFEYFSGIRKRAPFWMRKAGMEWLFRLILEPKRLWNRYLIGNFIFVYRVIVWWLRGRK